MNSPAYLAACVILDELSRGPISLPQMEHKGFSAPVLEDVFSVLALFPSITKEYEIGHGLVLRSDTGCDDVVLPNVPTLLLSLEKEEEELREQLTKLKKLYFSLQILQSQ